MRSYNACLLRGAPKGDPTVDRTTGHASSPWVSVANPNDVPGANGELGFTALAPDLRRILIGGGLIVAGLTVILTR